MRGTTKLPRPRRLWAVGTDGSRERTCAYLLSLTEHRWQVTLVGGLALAVPICGRTYERYECYLVQGVGARRCKLCGKLEAAECDQSETSSSA